MLCVCVVVHVCAGCVCEVGLGGSMWAGGGPTAGAGTGASCSPTTAGREAQLPRPGRPAWQRPQEAARSRPMAPDMWLVSVMAGLLTTALSGSLQPLWHSVPGERVGTGPCRVRLCLGRAAHRGGRCEPFLDTRSEGQLLPMAPWPGAPTPSG